MKQNPSEIEYPCQWDYKVITTDPENFQQNVPDVFGTLEYQLKESNRSKKGNYTSFHFATTVESQEHRDAVFKALQSIESVKMVL